MGIRKINLPSRVEGVREKFHTEVTRFNLDEIKKHFNETIGKIKAQFPVADDLLNCQKYDEAEYIWRSQIVFLASAFDFYMHELTKYGLCEIFDNNWEPTEKYSNIQVSLWFVEEALRSEGDIEWFLEYINLYYDKTTMVSFESVKDQINLLGMDINEIADGAFYQLGAKEKTIDKLKRRLNELFGRRNVIAHQSDRDHSDAQIRDISKDVVKNFVDDIEKIVQIIDKIAREK